MDFRWGQRLQRLSLVPAVLALCWVWRGLLRGEVFFERDQLLVFLPLKRYLSERLNAGATPSRRETGRGPSGRRGSH